MVFLLRKSVLLKTAGIFEIILGAIDIAIGGIAMLILGILYFDYIDSYSARSYNGYNYGTLSPGDSFAIFFIIVILFLIALIPTIVQIIFGSFAIRNKNYLGCMIFGYVMGGFSAFSLIEIVIFSPFIISEDSSTAIVMLLGFCAATIKCCTHFLLATCAQWQRKITRLNNYNGVLNNSNYQQNNKEYIEKEYLDMNKYNCEPAQQQYAPQQPYQQYPPYPPYPPYQQQPPQAPEYPQPPQYNPYYGYPEPQQNNENKNQNSNNQQ